jgi:hypothetical protein
MKNKFSNRRLSYFFATRIHGNVLAWGNSASDSEGSKHAVENILRWEDDGGSESKTGYPLPQVAEANTAPRMGATE